MTYQITFDGLKVEKKTICEIAESGNSKIYAGKDADSASWLIWEESNGNPVYIGWVNAGEAVTDENLEQSDFVFGENFSRDEVLEIMGEFSEKAG